MGRFTAVATVIENPEERPMKCNVGGIDRLARVALGIGLVAWAALLQGPAWAWAGAVPLATGLLGWCPLYLPFGLRTCKAKAR